MPYNILIKNRVHLKYNVYKEIVLLVLREFIQDYPSSYVKDTRDKVEIEFTNLDSFLKFVNKIYNIDKIIKEAIQSFISDSSYVDITKEINKSETKIPLIAKIFNELLDHIRIKTIIYYRLLDFSLENIGINIVINTEIEHIEKQLCYLQSEITINFDINISKLNSLFVTVRESTVTGIILDFCRFIINKYHDELTNSLKSNVSKIREYMQEIFGVSLESIMEGKADIEQLTSSQYLERLINYLKKKNFSSVLNFAIVNFGTEKIIKYYLEAHFLKEDEVLFYPVASLRRNPYMELSSSFERFLFYFYDLFLEKRTLNQQSKD